MSVRPGPMTRLIRALDNPLVAKDGVSRMRSWRAPFAITVYLGVLGLFGYALFSVLVYSSDYSHQGGAQIGAYVFVGLSYVQLALITLFAPALAAGAISGERERQTLDVLLVSQVSAFGIVWGKLVASLAYLLLLILTALPIFAAVFLFGGIDFEQFLLANVITVVTALTIGALSLFISAAFQRSLGATVTAYGTAFMLVIGTLVAGTLLTYLYDFKVGGGGPLGVHPLLFGSPLYALGVVLFDPSGGAINFGHLVQTTLFSAGGPAWGPDVKPWQLSVGAQLSLTVICVAGAVQIVRGRRASPLRRREVSA